MTRPALQVTAAVDELCDRFEEALQEGQRPELAAWLAEAGTLASAALPELALLELEYRVRQGEATTASDYFTQYPELLADPERATRLVAAEYRARARRGETPGVAELRQRYPALAASAAWQRGPWNEPTATVPETVIEPAATPSVAAPARRDPLAAVCPMLTPVEGEGLGRFGGYRVLDVLGSGGMGVVLSAVEESLRRPVALKVMWPELAAQPVARERFLREARAAAALEHPRVVGIHRVDEASGVPFLAMPLLRGQSLGARLRQRGQRGRAEAGGLPIAEAVRIGREAAEGLAAAHARGLVHRDIKPDNIWLEQGEQEAHVRLLDFGLAQGGEGEPLTQTGQVLGTPAYMAPEQAEARPVTAAADLFSLGAVLYEMVTGVRPFQRPTLLATLAAVATHEPAAVREVASGVPEALAELIAQLLAKRPERRPGSAAEVAAALARIEAGWQDATQVHSPVARSSPSRRWLGWAAAGLMGVALVAGLAVLLRGRTGEAARPVETVEVLALDLKRFPRRNEREADPAQLLGVGGPSAVHGDELEVEVRLSRPGYAYIVAFRPDGVVEVCYPESEDEAPAKTDRPRYPSRTRDARYNLDNGAGLWAFGVVVSDRPLPAFREWLAGRPSVWRGASESAGVPAGRLWRDDGRWVEEVNAGSEVRGERGKGGHSAGKAVVVRLTDWLRAGVPDGSASVVAFWVEKGE